MTAPAPATADRSRMSGLFWRYWAATNASSFGTAVTLVAMPLIAVSVLHSSALEVSALTAAGYVGWLAIGLPAGVIAQRYPVRALQVGMDVLRGAALLTLPLAWWAGHLTFVHLLLVSLVVGFANVVFDVANTAYLPTLIDREELTYRNSLVSGTYAVTQTGGPSLGGVLVQLMGPVGSLLVDVGSYVVSATIFGRLPHRPQPAPAAGVRFTELIAEGWTFVRRHAVMFPCMLWATAVNFVCGALLALTPVYLVREAGASPALVGVLIATDGVGSLIGSMIATRLARRAGSARALLIMSVVGALFALLLPLTTSPTTAWFFAVGNAGFAAGVVVGSIVTRSHRQAASPPELLSRVMATVRFVSWGALPIGAVAAGALASTVGLRPALWIACLASLTAPAIALAGPLRTRRDLADEPS